MVPWHYGEPFELKVLALALRDPTFYQEYYDVIPANYFEHLHLATLVQLLHGYAQSYRSLPTREALTALAIEHARRYGGERAFELERDLLAWLEYTYAADLSDGRFIADTVRERGRKKALEQAMLRALDVLKDDGWVARSGAAENGNGDAMRKVQQLFTEAFRVGARRDLGLDFSDVAPELQRLLRDDPIYGLGSKVPTGFSEIDRRLFGGVGRGELAVVCGVPGVGKTTFLVAITRAAAYYFRQSGLAKSVVYVTLEMKPPDIALMLAASTTSIPKDRILQGDGEYQERIVSYLPYLAGIRIRYFSPGTVTADDLRWYLANLRTAAGVDPGLIVVDYADRLKGGEDDRYRGMSVIFNSLKTTGDDFGCPVWTASQINREGARQASPNGTHVADSWAKKADSDLLVVLQQTLREYQRSVIRVFLDKLRRGPGGRQFYCHHFGERAAILEMLPEEAAQVEAEMADGA